jgi:hypothetical protein
MMKKSLRTNSGEGDRETFADHHSRSMTAFRGLGMLEHVAGSLHFLSQFAATRALNARERCTGMDNTMPKGMLHKKLIKWGTLLEPT